MITFIVVLSLFVGFVFAVKLSLLFQFIAIAAWLFYLNSSHIRTAEAALIPLAVFGLFTMGLMAGDLYYLLAFVPEAGGKIGDAIAWFFKP